jgi:hypothetical protein
MDEIQEKLAVLLKSAVDKKVKLKELKSIRKRQKYFGLNYKWKCFIAVAIAWVIYARFSHLFDSKKVGVRVEIN